MSIIRLDKLLNSGTTDTLGKIIRRAQDLDDLTTRLRDELGADTALALLAANVRDDGELVVVASSSAWAAKLRFEGESLMQAARDSGLSVTSFRVRVGSGT
ncbi:MAG: DUF721 domain-containing protein [Gammaproteobacteria bacterium]|nr:DUF721 domain-containing protein [Gammaproteobacteria bacterium]